VQGPTKVSARSRTDPAHLDSDQFYYCGRLQELNPMRLLRIRKTSIPQSHRDAFERFGEIAVLNVITSGLAPRAEELRLMYYHPDWLQNALVWLTEQSDRRERREDWLLVMEIAITLFVGIEVVPRIVGCVGLVVNLIRAYM
jgi:hypothetical protein